MIKDIAYIGWSYYKDKSIRHPTNGVHSKKELAQSKVRKIEIYDQILILNCFDSYIQAKVSNDDFIGIQDPFLKES